MHSIIAAGLFENPLIVAAIIIAGALINWLARKRQQLDQDREQREAEASQTARGALPTPPPLRSGTAARSPSTLWKEAEAAAQATLSAEPSQASTPDPHVASPTQHVPPFLPRPSLANRFPAARVIRLKRQKEQRRSPGKAVRSERRRPRRAGEQVTLWRERESARGAFVAFVVFGAPKGLEPS